MNYKKIFITLIAIICFYLLALLLMTTIFGLKKINGESMQPTFKGDGKEYFFSSKKKVPTYGDIVAINNGLLDHYVKRVIACPGDSVEINNGIVLVNGKATEYQKEVITSLKYYKVNKITLNNDEYYCLGDNINNSSDSREYGPFKKKQIRTATKISFTM